MSIHVKDIDDTQAEFQEGTLEAVIVAADGTLELSFGGPFHTNLGEDFLTADAGQLIAADKTL